MHESFYHDNSPYQTHMNQMPDYYYLPDHFEYLRMSSPAMDSKTSAQFQNMQLDPTIYPYNPNQEPEADYEVDYTEDPNYMVHRQSVSSHSSFASSAEYFSDMPVIEEEALYFDEHGNAFAAVADETFHMRVDDGSYCRQCDLLFNNPEELQEHMETAQIHNFKFICNTCEIVFPHEKALEKHFRTSEAHYREWKCRRCERRFTDRFSLRHHERDPITHRPRDIDCIGCDHKFKGVSSVAVHLENGCCTGLPLTRHAINHAVSAWDTQRFITKNAIEGPPLMERISKLFVTKQAFDRWSGLWICPLCNFGFYTQHGLEHHMNSARHDQPFYHCPKCRRETTTLSGLLMHIESRKCKFMNSIEDIVEATTKWLEPVSMRMMLTAGPAKE